MLAAEGRLAPARVARIAAQTLKALMDAHALGIVHRDIKPSNVFLCEFSGEADFVKVLDFGIAKNTLTRGDGAHAGGVDAGGRPPTWRRSRRARAPSRRRPTCTRWAW